MIYMTTTFAFEDFKTLRAIRPKLGEGIFDIEGSAVKIPAFTDVLRSAGSKIYELLICMRK